MKTIRIGKKTGRTGRTSGGTHRARRPSAPAQGVPRSSMAAAADRQIADIERTFTLRYEW
jgi:hypothetical protein